MPIIETIIIEKKWKDINNIKNKMIVTYHDNNDNENDNNNNDQSNVVAVIIITISLQCKSKNLLLDEVTQKVVAM